MPEARFRPGEQGPAFLRYRQLLAQPGQFGVEVDEFPSRGLQFTSVPRGLGIGQFVQSAHRALEMVGLQCLQRHATLIATPQVERHQRLAAAYRRPFPNVQRRHLTGHRRSHLGDASGRFKVAGDLYLARVVQAQDQAGADATGKQQAHARPAERGRLGYDDGPPVRPGALRHHFGPEQ